MTTSPDAPLDLADAAQWAAWLKEHHATSHGVWLRIAKKDSGERSVSYAEALDAALCQGWIDGQKKSLDERHWLQRFTPRSARSIWSKRNRDRALQLVKAGRMRAAGRAEIERAQKDGRWEVAYDGAAGATVPPDLQAALDTSPGAAAFFAALDSTNRYAILFRTHNAKRPETRARRIAQFVAMLARGEKIHS
jgi:uncharacterized protein YdeI (YjbR/CyaY-like superfamily)